VKKIKSLKVPELCDSTRNELRKQASNKLRQMVGVNKVSNNNEKTTTIKQTNQHNTKLAIEN